MLHKLHIRQQNSQNTVRASWDGHRDMLLWRALTMPRFEGEANRKFKLRMFGRANDFNVYSVIFCFFCF